MPRSRRRIDADNKARERCRTVISRSLKSFEGKPQAAIVAERIQGNPTWSKQIETDRPVLRYLWREGLKIEIRVALAEWGYSGSDEEPPQLDLFATDEREIVRQIGMARIWVPSRNAHVQYHGNPAAEVEESASYYKGLSIGLARTSTLLYQLAALRRKKPPSAKAA